MGEFIKRFENTQTFMPEEVEGPWGIPVIKPVEPYELDRNVEWIGFNFAISERHPERRAVHFYLDDYQFDRVWNNPTAYIPILRKFRCVLSPDFSIYRDLPEAVGLFSHYKKHWCASYWQSEGITVIPTICWGDEATFDWCFDGEPIEGVLSVSSCGCANSRYSRELFNNGYREMLERLKPSKVLYFGKDILDPDISRRNIEFHENAMARRFDEGHKNDTIRYRKEQK